MCLLRWLTTHLDRIRHAKYALLWSWEARSHTENLAKNIRGKPESTISVLEPGKSRIRSPLHHNWKKILTDYERVWSVSEVVGTEACLLSALWLPMSQWVFRGNIPSTHHVISATWSQGNSTDHPMSPNGKIQFTKNSGRGYGLAKKLKFCSVARESDSDEIRIPRLE